jgi:hypothetical protein
MSLVLSAAASCPSLDTFGRYSARGRHLQPPEWLNINPSQRSLELASIQLWCHDNQRPRLLCCGGLLHTVALELTSGESVVTDRRRFVARIMGRCFDVYAWRLYEALSLRETYLECQTKGVGRRLDIGECRVRSGVAFA